MERQFCFQHQELVRLTRSRRQTVPGEAAEDTDLGGVDNVERAMRRAIRQEVTRLERALTFLATTASARRRVTLVI